MGEIRHRQTALAVVAGLLSLTATACSGADGDIAEITVSGEFGRAAEVEWDTPFSVDETQQRVLIEGDGAMVGQGDLVLVHFVSLSGRTGTLTETTYDGVPSTYTVDDGILDSTLREALDGATEGSRVAVAIPPAEATGGTVLVVVDILDHIEIDTEQADGTAVEVAGDLPQVVTDDDGIPVGVEVPDRAPPTDLVVAPLIVGDGPVVESGDQVVTHNLAVEWEESRLIGSTWETGQKQIVPADPGAVIQGFSDAIRGQPLGSRLLVILPPDVAYGEAGNPSQGIEADDTVVLVVDLLALVPPDADTDGG